MDIFSVLNLVGGLALFLYGMNTMGDGLVALSGGKLEKILEKLTSNKLMGILTGTLVTGIIQSSSATTVMVVGFVNSGIMKLEQAVGIIMGANIGTTVTSWILSLTGIESTNVFVKLLKPSSFSPLFALIGIILIMLNKENSKKKNVGVIMIGFAVLMFGMETMSSSVAPLKSDPNFTSLMTKFSNPVLGILVGAGITAIIQSSSASVGILQALCSTGAVGYSVALPVIMGQNIGTCITAIISSIGANTNAKRASMIHLYFNLIGTIIFVIGFYSLNSFMHFAFYSKMASITGIAIIHSLFNIGCCIILYPFSGLLVKLAKLTIRDKKVEVEHKEELLEALDVRFLENPSFAIEQCNNAANRMAIYCDQMYKDSLSLFEHYDNELRKQIKKKEKLVDDYQDTLTNYLIQLSARSLSQVDSERISLLLYSTTDFERISDHSTKLAKIAHEMHEKGLSMSDIGKRDLIEFSHTVCGILEKTVTVFTTNNLEEAKEIIPLRKDVSVLADSTKERHIERLAKGECSIECGVYLEDIIAIDERIVSHCKSLAKRMIRI